MKQPPVLDPRSRQDILDQIAAHAQEYTPEWRYENAPDDPGSALASLFGDMFYQIVDRMNSEPGRFHTEFLNLTGFQMPDPAPAAGIMQFLAHDTVTDPVPVPAGTQVFTPDEADGNIIYETERHMEATPACLTHLFYVDPRAEIIQERDLTKPQTFFAPEKEKNLQRHTFSVSQNDVLALCGPCEVEAEFYSFQQRADSMSAETAACLTSPDAHWTFHASDGEVPFSSVQAEGSRIRLTYTGQKSFAPNADGHYLLTCSGRFGNRQMVFESVSLRSRPLKRLALDSVSCGDIPLDLAEGGYCLGRRPAAYSTCYFRSDPAFRKRGAQVHLRLEISPIVTDLTDYTVQYSFTQRIIDKRDAVAVVHDDVYIDEVVWEYFNGAGWRALPVSGNRNPFSGQETLETKELVFQVPDDLTETEVNAETGYFIRARVVHVQNETSQRPRWIVPFLKEADCTWSYEKGQPVDWCTSENNGTHREMARTNGINQLNFTALTGLEETPRSMYFCFDRSPHAMPLSLLFILTGRVQMADKLRLEAWTGRHFEPVRSVDLTRGLLQSGIMLLYLPEALPEQDFFGTTGYWIRLSRSSYQENQNGYPCVRSILLNAVGAVQRERAEEFFSSGPYEAQKQIQLLHFPVLDTQVWIDEVSDLAVADAQELAQKMPGRVRLEWEDRLLTHCWVAWERTEALVFDGPQDRHYVLEPYQGLLTFGDGLHGRVPPAGMDNIQVSYSFGGGEKGNCPAGTITEQIGALPRIRQVENITAMSGGTGRFPPEKVDAIGNSRLRHRGRAAGIRDFEDIVIQEFPQARHVKCFSERDAAGAYAPGHVTVVVEGSHLDNKSVADTLCDRIYHLLSQRCDCVLAAEGRLHVVASTVVTVSSRILVEMEDLDQSAVTQQAIVQRLEDLIDRRWREREIGNQIRLTQVWQTVRDTPNVRRIQRILLEGSYYEAGRQKMVPLESDTLFPYATVKSGSHIIQIV